jgi:RNA polymerase sigma-70 factor (sigma-E family)
VQASGELEAFCRREYPRLVGALSLYCGDAAVAEELAQEALARACDRWDRVREMHAPGAWVHRVAMNLANSHFRRRGAERRANARHGDDARDGYSDRDVASAVAVRQAVAGLPPKQRTAIALRYYLQYSVAETAEVMGCSPDAVKQHTHRAKDDPAQGDEHVGLLGVHYPLSRSPSFFPCRR